MKLRQTARSQDGYLIIICLIILTVVSVIGVSVGQLLTANYATTKRATYVTSAVLVAEAGLSDTIARITADASFSGYASRKQFFNNAVQGKGEYSSTVTSPTPSTRSITVDGYVYKDPASTANEVKKTIKATLSAQVNPTKYSVFAGPGGLTVGNGVVLRAGSIYVQGKVGVGAFSSIGTSSNPVDLKVSNLGCRAGGAGSAYPVQCLPGDPPLSFSLFGSSIYGTVCATDQTSENNIYHGTLGQGLIEDCVAESGNMPAFNKQSFVDSMNTPAQPASAGVCSWPSNTVTWNANTIFNGSVAFGAVCKVTIKGNVYIKGDLTSNLFVHFIVDESVTTPPVIVVNGAALINFSRVNANSAGVPMRIVSFKSTDTNCSTRDDCTALSSYDHVYNSVSTVATNCAGGPHGDMPGLIMQAYFGKANIGFGCSIGSVAGQAVNFDFFSGTSLVGQLSLDGTVTIDGWKVVDYQQTY